MIGSCARPRKKEDYGVDKPACQSLFLLASLNEQGWQQANAILAKLCKKAGEGSLPENCSAFVARAVLNALANVPGGWADQWVGKGAGK